MKTLEVTAAIVRQNRKILICQRPADKNCGLLWEFPGGKIEAGETGEQCIVHLHFYLCNIADGDPEKKEHNALAWITPIQVDQYEFCPADEEMLSSVDLKYI